MRRDEEIKREIEKLDRQKRELEQELSQFQTACKHDFTVEYTPDRQEARTFTGDPPGTMGIDRQLPFSVPAKTFPKWTRTCKNCGKQQETLLLKNVVNRGTFPGTSITEQVPDFGD
jgi:hypothetical protein